MAGQRKEHVLIPGVADMPNTYDLSPMLKTDTFSYIFKNRSPGVRYFYQVNQSIKVALGGMVLPPLHTFGRTTE